jgi:hypothetical protein
VADILEGKRIFNLIQVFRGKLHPSSKPIDNTALNTKGENSDNLENFMYNE